MKACLPLVNSQYPHFVFDTAKVLGTEKKEIIEEELEGELPF